MNIERDFFYKQNINSDLRGCSVCAIHTGRRKGRAAAHQRLAQRERARMVLLVRSPTPNLIIVMFDLHGALMSTQHDAVARAFGRHGRRR